MNTAKLLSPTLVAAVLGLASLAAGAADPMAALDSLPVADSAELEAARGADNQITIVTSRQDMRASVTGASFNVGTMNNGDITVGEGAFANFSGVGVNVLNSGNNNAFSTGVSMSVHLH
ncbi:hypothetical protein [Sediminicurvatus halobius]|uniref:Uncharacterized protein n=1 Tax=Sediminicurvatus halobius TaxID=2182432 RepID=A0A2U2N6Y5_9GAMM|nr:hypothetical protein [Spiribacter halobius]PWG64842.1 hypothetical protein DEM34_03325 [Spiribacter halobius]UEX78306.1 hypothetical protein LMH63_01285 [Spiribacter halobius]